MKQKKASPAQQLTESTRRENAHHSSARLNSKLIVLACEAGEVDREVVALTAAVANAKERRAHLAAVQEGLRQALAQR